MKDVLIFPVKAVYFVWRWFWYLMLFPLGIWSLLRRNSKKNRQKMGNEMEQSIRRSRE